MFEGGQGFLNGNLQDPVLICQHKRMNNPVFEPDLVGVGLRKNVNEPIKRIENFQPPPGAPMANPPLIQPVQQPPNLVERNDIINLIHEVCGPLTRGVATPVYRNSYSD